MLALQSQARRAGSFVALTAAALLAACSEQPSTAPLSHSAAIASLRGADNVVGGVFVTTNDPTSNGVVAFSRASDGSLASIGTFATGGKGIGGSVDPLASQFALALSRDHKLLYVVNAGSNDVSVFRVRKDGLELLDRSASQGTRPVSVAIGHQALYVLNAGSNDIGIFGASAQGTLTARGVAKLSGGALGAAEIRVSPDGHFVNVTERVSNTIDSYVVAEDGTLGGLTTAPSGGTVPFGFDYAPNGLLVVSEAASASASSYTQDRSGQLSLVSSAISTGGQGAPCWLIVTNSGRFAYTANAGGASVSGFAIAEDGSLTLITPGGKTGDLGAGAQPLDLDLSRDSRFLYVMKNGTGTIGAFAVNADGTLEPLADTPGLLARGGYMGLAAY